MPALLRPLLAGFSSWLHFAKDPAPSRERGPRTLILVAMISLFFVGGIEVLCSCGDDSSGFPPYAYANPAADAGDETDGSLDGTVGDAPDDATEGGK
jgi:hypothetical protein